MSSSNCSASTTPGRNGILSPPPSRCWPVGAALASRPPHLDATLEQRLDAILDEEWPKPGGPRRAIGTLARPLPPRSGSAYAELRALVIAHASAMKGGRAGAMLDAERVIGPLRGGRAGVEIADRPTRPARQSGARRSHIEHLRCPARRNSESSSPRRRTRSAGSGGRGSTGSEATCRPACLGGMSSRPSIGLQDAIAQVGIPARR